MLFLQNKGCKPHRLRRGSSSWRCRYAEFSRACAHRTLQQELKPDVVYYGMFRREQQHKSVCPAIDTAVFKHWDDLASSPPKTRQRPEASFQIAGLSLASCTTNGQIAWPSHIETKFPEGSEQRKVVEKLKATFMAEFPETGSSESARRPQAPPRVQGSPDFSVDGASVLDIERCIDLEKVDPPSSDQRPVVNL